MTMPQTFVVPLSEIIYQPGLQPRIDGLDEAHILALMEAPESWPPIIVVWDGSRFIVVDGNHRLAGARALHLEAITVQVVPMPPDGDLLALAFAYNAQHGLPLTLDDRKAYAKTLIARASGDSDREIARHCGLSHPTVGALRRELASMGTRHPAADTKRMSTPRQQARAFARHLERLAGAFDQGDTFDAAFWQPDTAAAIVKSAFGDDSEAVAASLGYGAAAVLNIAVALGFDPDDGT